MTHWGSSERKSCKAGARSCCVVNPWDQVAVQFWIIQSLNGVAYGMLLFLLSAGLSLILGMMKIANLAHGAFYLQPSKSLETTQATQIHSGGRS
jgi:hypothetical protein